MSYSSSITHVRSFPVNSKSTSDLCQFICYNGDNECDLDYLYTIAHIISYHDRWACYDGYLLYTEGMEDHS